MPRQPLHLVFTGYAPKIGRTKRLSYIDHGVSYGVCFKQQIRGIHVAQTESDQALLVEPIRAFQDNYIWLLTRAGSDIACVVDPGDAEPVIAALQSRGLSLGTILLTHHHADHVGGVKELVQKYAPTVYGPANSRIEGIDIPLREGEQVHVMGCDWQVLEVPGHTMDHIAYFTSVQASVGVSKPLLFCGDTLFASGCGRMFEGTPTVMLASLQKLAALPEQSLVYCAHEYTLANIRFALAAEPENSAIAERFRDDSARLQNDNITIPSTIELELRTNPFLRCHIEGLRANPALADIGNTHSDAEVFAALRNWKDNFR